MEAYEKRNQIRAGLGGRLAEIFDSLWARADETDPETVLAAAKRQLETEDRSEKISESWDAADKLERRQETCYYKYIAAHPEMALDARKEAARAFYASHEPEDLAHKTVAEILALAAAA